MEPSSTRAEKRIDELEARLAEQDQSMLELSDELYRQQRQIAKLEIEVQRLAERQKVSEPQAAAADSTEIPPHY
jgi:SlyX protein